MNQTRIFIGVLDTVLYINFNDDDDDDDDDDSA